MINFRRYLFVITACVNTIAFAQPLTSYWQCTTNDANNKLWIAKSIYQKAALNIAFANCKKQSTSPSSCKASVNDCEGFNQNMSIRPMWQCTALDESAESWRSNFYAQRDDAALGAKEFCKNKSTVPATCYINMVTCVNYRAGELL